MNINQARAVGVIHKKRLPSVNTDAHLVFGGMVGQRHWSGREQNQAAGAGRPGLGTVMEARG